MVIREELYKCLKFTLFFHFTLFSHLLNHMILPELKMAVAEFLSHLREYVHDDVSFAIVHMNSHLHFF